MRVAVEGDPDTTVPVPICDPSSRKETVPLAAVTLVLGAVMVAVKTRELLAAGVRVAGDTTTVGAAFATVRVTAVAVEVA